MYPFFNFVSLSLMVYKRSKQRQEVDYGQQLRQQRVDGSVSRNLLQSLSFPPPTKLKVNPYKLGFITLTMAVILTFLVLHQFVVSESNIQVKFDKSSHSPLKMLTEFNNKNAPQNI